MKTRKSALAAVMIAVGSSVALAQQPLPPATPNATPPATPPVVTAPVPGSAGQMWYTRTGTEWRASKLIGTGVQNQAGERIGEINELVLGSDGRVVAVVLGVGGFLGIGEREVAMSFSALRFTRDSSGKFVVTTNATRDMLQNAPRWTWQSAAN